MLNMWLIQQRATKIDFSNNLSSTGDSQVNIEVAFKYDFKVEYASDLKHCRATIAQKVESKSDPKSFHVLVEVEGVFETDPILDDNLKKEAHVRCYSELFPYVQSLVAQIGVAAGGTSLIVPPDRISIENVFVAKES